MMTGFSNFADLWVANWPKTRNDDALPLSVHAALNSHGPVLDTCLRQLCIAAVRPDAGTLCALPAAVELLSGPHAYRFALEVATGLRSDVPGETNVFGQFKGAWQDWRRSADAAAMAPIAPTMHRLFNDARAIRRDHLQGIGGASYGSLVRRLLPARRGDRLLFVGAGNLARSMLPYFSRFDVALWNRRDVADAPPGVHVFAPGSAADAAAWADDIVFTTPPDARNDAMWRDRIGGAAIRSLIHLGYRRGEMAAWPTLHAAFDLDDVFELRRRQAGVRSSQLERARIACDAAAFASTDHEAPVTARYALA